MMDPRGMTSAQAAQLLAADGPNEVITETGRGRWKRLLGPLADPMVALLLVAGPAYLALGQVSDAITTLVAIVPIVGIGWFLESRARRSLAQLHTISAPTATVLRDGQWLTVPTRDVVVGDVFRVVEGDVVPADGAVLESTQLAVDESSLTGESLPVDIAVGGPISAATVVTSGSAMVTATATGPRSALGTISELLRDTSQPPTPLQLAMRGLVTKVAVVAGIATVAVVLVEWARGSGWQQAVISGISLLLAAVPEEFSVVYALYLSIGAWRLTQHKALIRNLPSAEALGSVTVICTDKTGTVTQGSLVVAEVHTVREPQRVLADAVLASERNPFDPIDTALTAHAAASGVDGAWLAACTQIADWPFEDNRVTHVWRLPDGTTRVAAKGSLESLLNVIDPPDRVRNDLIEVHDRMAAEGFRIIAVASTDDVGDGSSRDAHEAGLAFDGLVAFHDPLRAGVAEAVAECASAGVRVIMITGDHPATSQAIAREMAGGEVIVATGAEAEQAAPAELRTLVHRTDVFARTKPHQKHMLVTELRRQGEVVAMTGDGVNDAPALRAADIGIAMGVRGTAVAREASAMILLDDNFVTIVAAIRNGRRLYDNLTRAFRYLIAVHIPIILAAAIVPMTGGPLLLLPVHLVLLEVLLHPIVSLVFQADPAAPGIMQRPPRPADYALTWRALRPAVLLGIVLAAAVVGAYLVAIAVGWPEGQARALGFTVLLLAQPPTLIALRTADLRQWRRVLTPEFALASAACVLTALGTQWAAPLARLTYLEPLSAAGWGAAIGLAVIATLAPALVVLARRTRAISGTSSQ